jgi:RHS repeat-associated protein
VWGLRYIDDLALRDRDTDDSGTLDERLYAMQDGNWNVVAVGDDGGEVQFRFAYEAYGHSAEYNGSFFEESNSQWFARFAGAFLDQYSNLYHVRNRVINTGLGNWLSRDPMFIWTSESYRYGNNSPLTMVDPLGLQAGMPISPEEHKRLNSSCQEYYEKTISTDKRFVSCWQAILRRANLIEQSDPINGKLKADECRSKLKIICQCCPRETTGAFYRQSAHTVYLCSNNRAYQGENLNRAIRNICHEFVHVLQFPPCNPDNKPLDKISCAELVYYEMFAYFCTGECRRAEVCLIEAIRSGIASGKCGANGPTGEEQEKMIRLFAKMIKDGKVCEDQPQFD